MTSGGDLQVIDGRRARGQRTRLKVIEALLELVSEGVVRPTAQEIAARAGVALRTVYHHFEDVEALRRLALDLDMQRHFEILTLIDTNLPLEERIVALAAQCRALYEAVTPIRRATLFDQHSSPDMARGVANATRRAPSTSRRCSRPSSRNSARTRSCSPTSSFSSHPGSAGSTCGRCSIVPPQRRNRISSARCGWFSRRKQRWPAHVLARATISPLDKVRRDPAANVNQEVAMTPDEIEALANLARQLRVDSIRCTTAVGAGHPTSSLSAADLLAVLATRHLHYDWSEPKRPENDHLIFSKGHASPLLYSVFRAVGVVSEDELLETYRRFGARLQGHPTPVLPWVDLATGSLGVGVAAAVGVGIAGKYLDELPYRIFALCGDSEMAEGSVWEAFDKAAYYELSNFTAIVDVNRLGQRGPTELGWDLDAYAARVTAFGCHPIVIDGHDLEEIDAAFSEARSSAHPSVILARTIKGKGVPEIEDKNGWHGTALPADMAEQAIAALGGPTSIVVTSPKPDAGIPAITPNPQAKLDRPHYAAGDKVATRLCLRRRPRGALRTTRGCRPRRRGRQLDALGGVREGGTEALLRGVHLRTADGRRGVRTRGAALRALRSDLRRVLLVCLRLHPHGRDLRRRNPPVGIALRRRDRIRRPVPDGARGPRGDARSERFDGALPLRRAVDRGARPADGRPPRSLLCPHDAGAYPVLYSHDEDFPIGGAKVLRSGPADVVTLVGAGVTVHESLAAADQLGADGIAARCRRLLLGETDRSDDARRRVPGYGRTDHRHRGSLPGGRTRRGRAQRGSPRRG